MKRTRSPSSYPNSPEGVDNTTGAALVEAYDAGANGTRVVNLSTRGYADVGREMIGGFVVQGDPAQPKRILIRVLGPSLTNFGVSNVLGDPFMSIYDARSNCLAHIHEEATSIGLSCNSDRTCAATAS